jgi:hypothetical protein
MVAYIFGRSDFYNMLIDIYEKGLWRSVARMPQAFCRNFMILEDVLREIPVQGYL